MAATMKMGQVHLLSCLVMLALASQVQAKSKYVTLNLSSKWKSTPLLLEMSEYMAQESNEMFWNFVNAIGEMEPSMIGEGHEQGMYDLGLKVASRYLSPLQLRLLKFSISIRTYSPTVEMFNSIACEKKAPAECDMFIEVGNTLSCDVGAAKAFLKVSTGVPTLLNGDHRYHGNQHGVPTMILYAEIGRPAFHKAHTELRAMAEQGKILYVLRHFIRAPSDRKLRLSGYGVELAIKSQEYKAKDDTKVEEKDKHTLEKDEEEDEVQGFVFSQLKQLYPDLHDDLDSFRSHLVETNNEMSQLKVWQLQDLSFQAAQRVISAEPSDALKVMRDISQNFPVRARSLVQTVVKDELRQEILKNQQVFESMYGLGTGDSAFFINGLQVDMDVHDIFMVLDMMKSEAKLMEGLHALGITGENLSNLLKLDLRDTDSNYAVDVRDTAVVYINNIEKDRKYASWPGSVQEMLRPTFPGMLRHVRKNFFNMVFFIDPSDKRYKDLLKMAEAFYVHSAPVRLGIVLMVNKDVDVDAMSDPGVAMLRGFNYISKQHSPTKALSFLTDVYERVGDNDITADIVMNEFSVSYPSASTGDVFGINSQYDKWRGECWRFFEQTGLGDLPQVLVNGVPMRKDEMNADSFEEAVVSGILKATPELQKAVYNGQIYDGMDIMDFVMTRSNVMPRLNARILAPSEQFLDFTKEAESGAVDQAKLFSRLTATEMTSVVMKSLKYLTKKDEKVLRPVTNWVVADLDTPEGRLMVYGAVKALKHSSDTRLGFINNPTKLSGDGEGELISQAIHAAMETQEPGIARSFVTKLLKEENVEALKSGAKTMEDLAVNKMDMDSFKKVKETAFLKIHKAFCNKALNFQPGERGIITNGKVIGPLRTDEVFLQEDFTLSEKYAKKVYADKIKAKINTMKLDSSTGSDMIMRVAALLLSIPQKEGRRDIDFHTDLHSVVKISAEPGSPAYDVVAILDPTTRAAQKITPIIMVLQEVVNCNIRVFLNSKEKLSEAPLKSFYRFILDPEVTFTIDGLHSLGPATHFQDMPQKPLLTLGMDPPESWLVTAIKTTYDLDNIYLEEVKVGVQAEFELEYLLLEGHCYDSSTGQPPRGLQFILGTNSTPAMVDTIVMANLGYFQLKANPGAWMLRLRPGRSADIYDISSHDFTDSPPDSKDVVVVLDSFKSKIIKVRVNKKSGKEKEDLLGEAETGGLWDSISRSFSGRGTEVEEKKDDTLNIFSVASGHLYERFLRIMMLSVLKNTQSKVKFWFLANFLSPTFKDFIPHMAEKYSFEYELVQYKWPRWLHQQTEKQRIIWGYKILFLDVLFPLDVQKIIFVDADQIVRTDLQELQDFDLEGAPYGYTPFCDSKQEMDGFRFWKSGYWASHLAGRKYHISALYVVDLKKFRKIAAGDRLRGQYQGLSQDPNSLSNLDQDLPNNMIHQVNIKSLPQEWLWCETWCSQEEKKTAKTIDLCNNPLTKEPKLEAAVRIVPEWVDYDKEARKLWDNVFKSKDSPPTKHSGDQDVKKDEL